MDNVLKREIEKDPKIKENNTGLFSELSVLIVSRHVHELGYTSHQPVKKLIVTRVQKVRRVRYVLKYIEGDDAEWLDVLWSDKAMFTVTEGRSGHVYQKCGSDPLDSCYTAKLVKTWLKDCGINFFEDWPGNSPDLNQIENLWQVVKQGLQGKDVSSLPKLEKEIRAIWDTIPTQKIHDLVKSMP